MLLYILYLYNQQIISYNLINIIYIIMYQIITCQKGIHGLQFKYKNGLATSVCGTVLPTHQAKFTVIYNEQGCNLEYISGTMQTHPSGIH